MRTTYIHSLQGLTPHLVRKKGSYFKQCAILDSYKIFPVLLFAFLTLFQTLFYTSLLPTEGSCCHRVNQIWSYSAQSSVVWIHNMIYPPQICTNYFRILLRHHLLSAVWNYIYKASYISSLFLLLSVYNAHHFIFHRFILTLSILCLCVFVGSHIQWHTCRNPKQPCQSLPSACLATGSCLFPAVAHVRPAGWWAFGDPAVCTSYLTVGTPKLQDHAARSAGFQWFLKFKFQSLCLWIKGFFFFPPTGLSPLPHKVSNYNMLRK